MTLPLGNVTLLFFSSSLFCLSSCNSIFPKFPHYSMQCVSYQYLILLSFPSTELELLSHLCLLCERDMCYVPHQLSLALRLLDEYSMVLFYLLGNTRCRQNLQPKSYTYIDFLAINILSEHLDHDIQIVVVWFCGGLHQVPKFELYNTRRIAHAGNLQTS